eukprot:TRINITY_DN5477_c0_g1_i4.p1 TRINITY_DN5477_c0_g1~~TRINITY_DN5477_c0_g1_i4.p1  ORF type:complete len:332 (-),score=46.39 TRINITY_DN5477_c0_g1_i4:132-1127(-)
MIKSASSVRLVLVLGILMKSLTIKEDYVHTEVCPMVLEIKSSVAMFDSGLFFLTKGLIHGFCISEDAFWRLFTDAWVRSIVTETDSLFLVLSALIWAMLWYQLILWILFAVVAFCYAAIFSLWRQVEFALPKNRLLLFLGKCCRWFNIIRIPGQSDAPTPKTCVRTRPAADYVDCLTYWTGRKLRHFWIYFSGACNCLYSLLLFCVVATAALRLLCIFAGAGWVFRHALSALGFRERIDMHSEWFRHLPKEDYSDHILWRVLDRILLGAGGAVTSMGWLPWAFFIAAAGLFLYLNWKKGQDFEKRWADGLREQCLESALGSQEDSKGVPTS